MSISELPRNVFDILENPFIEPQTVILGDMKFYAIVPVNGVLELFPELPDEMKPKCYYEHPNSYHYFDEWQKAKLDYCREALFRAFGENCKVLDSNLPWCEIGYEWNQDGYKITTFIGRDIHGNPLGGRISIKGQGNADRVISG